MFEGETGVVCGAHLGGRDLVRGYGRAHARPGCRGCTEGTRVGDLLWEHLGDGMGVRSVVYAAWSRGRVSGIIERNKLPLV